MRAVPSCAMASGSRGKDTNMTSPELVLVSEAEMAQRARDDLPSFSTGSGDKAQPPTPGPHRIAEPPPYPRISIEDPTPRRRSARRRRRRGRGVLPLVAVLALLGAAALGWFFLRSSDGGGTGSSSTAGAPGAAAGFVPARTWVWSASRGAHAYLFQMSLNGKVVVSARTTQPRFELPASFKFGAGNYRWVVRRIPKPADGRLLSESKFVLTSATAAQANR